MQTPLQAALERAVRRLPPDQAVTIPHGLTGAFLSLPVAHRRALLVASRLEVWVSMMTYEPSVARRYAFCMAGGTLPLTTSEGRERLPQNDASVATGRARKWLAGILSQDPAQLEGFELDISRLMLQYSPAHPSVSRYVVETQLGEYGIAALAASGLFKRVVSSHELAKRTCPIYPRIH